MADKPSRGEKNVEVWLILSDVGSDTVMMHGFLPSPPRLNLIHAHILVRQRGRDNAAAGFMGRRK